MRAHYKFQRSQSQKDNRGKNTYRRSDAIKREKDLHAIVDAHVQRLVEAAIKSVLGKKKRGQADQTDYESELNFDVLKVSDPDSNSDSD